MPDKQNENCTQPAACVCGGFDYVFLNRTTSEDVYKFVHDWMLKNVGGISEERARGEAHRLTGKTDFPSGGYELLGVGMTDKGEWFLRIKAKAEPQKPTPPDAPKGSGNGVEVTENKEKGGLEIRFPSMPSDAIRDFMKDHNWRWSKFAKCWWHKDTEEARQVAATVVAMWEKENTKAAA